jgi:large subunit ribosomal protein L25
MSNANISLNAQLRADLGKGASRRLRHEDKVPAILYGGNEAPVSLMLDHNKVIQAQEFENFYSQVLTLNIEGKVVDVLLKDVQRHPYKLKVTHLDFQRVVAGQDLHTSVPIHFINEELCQAIKDGAVAEHHVTEVEISCLPKNIPEFITVDMTNVALGETVHLSNLALPEGVSSVELGKNDEAHDLAVVTVKAAPKAAAVDEDDAADAGEETTTEE